MAEGQEQHASRTQSMRNQRTTCCPSCTPLQKPRHAYSTSTVHRDCAVTACATSTAAVYLPTAAASTLVQDAQQSTLQRPTSAGPGDRQGWAWQNVAGGHAMARVAGGAACDAAQAPPCEAAQAPRAHSPHVGELKQRVEKVGEGHEALALAVGLRATRGKARHTPHEAWRLNVQRHRRDSGACKERARKVLAALRLWSHPRQSWTSPLLHECGVAASAAASCLRAASGTQCPSPPSPLWGRTARRA